MTRWIVAGIVAAVIVPPMLLALAIYDAAKTYESMTNRQVSDGA